MIQSNKKNIDIKLLALIRPGDPLFASIQTLSIKKQYDLTIVSNIIEIASFLEIPSEGDIVFLLGRPAMLGNVSLMDRCKATSVQLIGWMGPEETCGDKSHYYAAQAGMIMVNSLEQVIHIIQEFEKKLLYYQTAHCVSIQNPDCKQIDQQAYRLSHEELDALLGAN